METLQVSPPFVRKSLENLLRMMQQRSFALVAQQELQQHEIMMESQNVVASPIASTTNNMAPVAHQKVVTPPRTTVSCSTTAAAAITPSTKPVSSLSLQLLLPVQSQCRLSLLQLLHVVLPFDAMQMLPRITPPNKVLPRGVPLTKIRNEIMCSSFSRRIMEACLLVTSEST